MSDKYKFWEKVVFWDNVKKTIAVFAAPGVFALHKLGAADGWMMFASACTAVGAVLAIWAVDSDKNGRVDLFD
jgi:hypothetical protein